MRYTAPVTGDPPNEGEAADPRGAPEPDSGFLELMLDRLARRREGPARYEVSEKLTQGGMGEIHRVWDVDLRRPLAMKVLAGQGTYGTREELVLARFLEEAQITGQLDHPGIVPVHDLGLDGRGGPTSR